MIRTSLILLCSLFALAHSEIASACDRCRALGVPAYHDASLGGDAFDDAFAAPPDDEEQGGSASFVPTGGKWFQPGGLGTRVEISYSYQNMFDGGLKMPNGEPLPAALIRESIEDAMRVWSRHAPLYFIEVEDDGLTYAQGSVQYGDIRFRHVFINGPDPPPPAQPIAKAQAWFPFGGTLAGDVEYDHGDPWQEVGTLPIPDILGATIHELGHSLGLNHTSVTDANMYWIFRRNSGVGSGALHADDIAGIQFIYGAGQGDVIPLRRQIPEPATALLGFVAVGAAMLFRSRRPRR